MGRLVWQKAPGNFAAAATDPLIGGEVTRTFWGTNGRVASVVVGCTVGGVARRLQPPAIAMLPQFTPDPVLTAQP